MLVTTTNIKHVILAEIPECDADFEADELPHLMLSELFRWTESATRDGRNDDMTRALRLVDDIFRACDDTVKNGVTVSFLECVDPEDEAGRKIFDALTPELRQQWHALDEYMKELIGKSLRGSVARNAELRRSE
jgi:hypothetical protein